MNNTAPTIRTLHQTILASTAFVREWLRSPRSIGMVCPSGTELARAMAEPVPLHSQGIVVEIGAGTGTVTRELIRAGVDNQRLLVLERAPAMANLLKKRFPTLSIIQGDAANLQAYLPRGAQVDCIVSSLPLISLPADIRQAILAAMSATLAPGGRLVQYTYSWRGTNRLFRENFRCVGSRRIWHNVPPAQVFWFEKI